MVGNTLFVYAITNYLLRNILIVSWVQCRSDEKRDSNRNQWAKTTINKALRSHFHTHYTFINFLLQLNAVLIYSGNYNTVNRKRVGTIKTSKL